MTSHAIGRRVFGRVLLLRMVLLVLSTGCGAGQDQAGHFVASCPDCNVLLISLDTLRADHLGAYGYGRDTSPSIDEIAAQGILFRRTFAQAPWTLPSHFSILTGLYPSRHQIVYHESTAGPDLETFADLFQEHGYATAAFTGGAFMSQRWGYGGFTVFHENSAAHAAWPEVRASAKMAVDWMTSIDEPFFALWHTFAPHAPYVPDDRFDLWADPGYDGIVDTVPGRNVEFCGDDPACRSKRLAYYRMLRDEGLLQEEDIQHVVARYDGVVRSTDEIVGYIWRSLAESGRLARTIVVITSDHGETLIDEGLSGPLGHPNPTRGVIHVPWILWTPQDSARELNRVVESIDILPTVAAVLGISVPWEIDGHNALDPAKNEMPELAVSEYWKVKERELLAHSLVWRDWHLIRWNDGRRDAVFLYDMERDPAERDDLSSSEPQLLARLEGMLDRWKRVIGDRVVSSPTERELESEAVEELEALGYL